MRYLKTYELFSKSDDDLAKQIMELIKNGEYENTKKGQLPSWHEPQIQCIIKGHLFTIDSPRFDSKVYYGKTTLNVSKRIVRRMIKEYEKKEEEKKRKLVKSYLDPYQEIKKMSTEELEKLKKEYLDKEDYETAAIIRNILNLRNSIEKKKK